MNDCSCDSHREARRIYASMAGDGLPAIEPGMPLPAGTGLDRRQFLSRTTGLALSVYGASALAPSFLDAGIEDGIAAAPAAPVVVAIYMDGGADHLSILSPVEDSQYLTYRKTPGLYFDEDAGLKAAGMAGSLGLQWNPRMTGFKQLHDAGKMAVFPAIGVKPVVASEHADQSHFTSRHYWEVGALNTQLRTGWVGRYLDIHGSADNPLQGLSLESALSPVLATAVNPIASMTNPRDFQFGVPGVSGTALDYLYDAFKGMGTVNNGDEEIEYARRVARQTGIVREQMNAFAGGQDTSGNQALAFSDKLTLVADMLSAGLPLRYVALDAPGQFDTHSNQADPGAPRNLSDLLGGTSDGIFAFQQLLEQRGLADRVLIYVWSEFGRRVNDNGSGTDHGAAGFGCVIGTKVRGKDYDGADGSMRSFPGLGSSGVDALNNQRPTSDFRGVYAAILSQWLGVDAGPIVPGADKLAQQNLIPSLIV